MHQWGRGSAILPSAPCCTTDSWSKWNFCLTTALWKKRGEKLGCVLEKYIKIYNLGVLPIKFQQNFIDTCHELYSAGFKPYSYLSHDRLDVDVTVIVITLSKSVGTINADCIHRISIFNVHFQMTLTLLSVCLLVFPSVSLSFVCHSVCLCFCLPACLSVCLGLNSEKVICVRMLQYSSDLHSLGQLITTHMRKSFLLISSSSFQGLYQRGHWQSSYNTTLYGTKATK